MLNFTITGTIRHKNLQHVEVDFLYVDDLTQNRDGQLTLCARMLSREVWIKQHGENKKDDSSFVQESGVSACFATYTARIGIADTKVVKIQKASSAIAHVLLEKDWNHVLFM